MKGNPLTDARKETIVELFEEGVSPKDIAERLNLGDSTVRHLLAERGLTQKKDKEAKIDLSNIERKLDEMPDVLVRRISEIIEFTPNMSEHILSLESIGYKSKDKKVYCKIDGNQSRQIAFHNASQITYSTKDIKSDREIERYYFNSETLEAIFGAILDRGWNYFRK